MDICFKAAQLLAQKQNAAPQLLQRSNNRSHNATTQNLCDDDQK